MSANEGMSFFEQGLGIDYQQEKQPEVKPEMQKVVKPEALFEQGLGISDDDRYYLEEEKQEDFFKNLPLYGRAAYKGAAEGAWYETPEKFYRVVDTFADMFGGSLFENYDAEAEAGLDSFGYNAGKSTEEVQAETVEAGQSGREIAAEVQEWARNNIDELKAEKAKDPFYQPDPEILNSPVARSLKEGIGSFISSSAMAAPVVAGTAAYGVATGGTGYVPLILGLAAGSGSTAGLAEYSEFIDEAYEHYSRLNPQLTREQVQDVVHDHAFISAVAEGGLEFAGDVLAGKLIGKAGKGIVGSLGGKAWQYHRNYASKLLSGVLLKSPAGEIPTELTTAAVQDKARELAGMDYQGMANAAKQAFGPTLVASFLGGAVKTNVEHLTNSSERVEDKAHFQNAQQLIKQEKQAKVKARRDALAENKVVQDISGNKVSSLLNSLKEEYYSQQLAEDEELTPEKNNRYKQEAKEFVSFLQGKGKFTEQATDRYQKYRKKVRDKLEEAQKLGLLDEENIGMLTNLYKGFNLPDTVNLEQKTKDKIVKQQLDVLFNKKEGAELSDKVASSLTSGQQELPSLGEWAQVLEKDGALDALKQKDIHKFDEVMERGQEALSNGFDLGELSKHVKVNENSDSVVLAAGLLSEAAEDKAFAAAINYNEDQSTDNLAALELALREQDELFTARQKLATAAGRELRMHGLLKQAEGQDIHDKAQQVINAGGGAVEAQQLAVLLENMIELADAKQANQQAHVEVLKREVMKIFDRARSSPQGITKKDWAKVDKLFRMTNWRQKSMNFKPKGRYTRIRDLILDVGISGMLSNPATHVANFIGNSSAVLTDIFETYLAEAGTEKNNTAGVQKGETGAMLHAAMTGFWDAIRAGTTAFATNKSNFGKNEKAGSFVANGFSSSNIHSLISGRKNDLTREQLQAHDGLGQLAKFAYKSIDIIDDWGIHLPGRTMIGCDDFFKTMVYFMKRRQLAFRESAVASKNGGDADAEYNKIMSGGTAPQGIHEQLMEDAARLTFQDRPKTTFWKGVEAVRRSAPSTMFFVPFLRTGLNISKWTGVRTPLVANLFSEYRQSMKSADPAVRQKAESQMLAGTMIWYTALSLAAEGLITGAGPKDKKERDALYATGWQPNSIKLGDTYYQLNRLDPLASYFNITATFSEMQNNLSTNDSGEALSALFGSAVTTVRDRYYFKGIADAVNAVSNHERYGKRFRENIGASFLAPPASAGRRGVTKTLDPVMREAHGYIEKLYQTMPGLSDKLAPKRNMFGEPLRYGEHPVSILLSPVRYSSNTGDKVMGKLAEMYKAGEFKYYKPRNYFKKNGNTIYYSSKEYSELLRNIGEVKIDSCNMRQATEKLFNDEEFQGMDDEEQADALTKLMRKFRKLGTAQFRKQVLKKRQLDIAKKQSSDQSEDKLAQLLKAKN